MSVRNLRTNEIVSLTSAKRFLQGSRIKKDGTRTRQPEPVTAKNLSKYYEPIGDKVFFDKDGTVTVITQKTLKKISPESVTNELYNPDTKRWLKPTPKNIKKVNDILANREFLQLATIEPEILKATPKELDRTRITEQSPLDDAELLPKEFNETYKKLAFKYGRQMRTTTDRRNRLIKTGNVTFTIKRVQMKTKDGRLIFNEDGTPKMHPTGNLWELFKILKPFTDENITIYVKLQDGKFLRLHMVYKDFFEVLSALSKDSATMRDDIDFNSSPNLSITTTQKLKGKDWAQVFRYNQTNTCVIDAIHKEFYTEDPNKNTKTLLKKIDKLREEYPNGMTIEDIQTSIVDALRIPIIIKPFVPIAYLTNELRPSIDGFNKRTVTLINSRPHHVDLFIGSSEKIYLEEDLFNRKFNQYTNSPLYVEYGKESISSFISKDGHFILDKPRFNESVFYDQYKDHIEIYDENNMNAFQALSFTAEPLYYDEGEFYEYDLNQAYLNYEYDFAGYLIESQDCFIAPASLDFQNIVSAYETKITTLYLQIEFTEFSDVDKLFAFPRVLVCPYWFLECLTSSYIITKYEVRKPFYINMFDVEESFNEFNDVKDPTARDRNWKKTYTQLYGKTAMRQKIRTYDLRGIESEDFFEYCKTQIPNNLKKDYKFYKRIDYKDMPYPEYNEDGDQLNYEEIRNIKKYNDLQPTKFCVVEKTKEYKNCPQILNSVNLYCLKRLIEVAKSVPIDDIVGKTLDSIILKKQIHTPSGFKEKVKMITQTHSKEDYKIIDKLPPPPYTNKILDYYTDSHIFNLIQITYRHILKIKQAKTKRKITVPTKKQMYNLSRGEERAKVKILKQTEISFSKQEIRTFKNPTPTQYKHINYCIGSGGAGKTYDLTKKFPNALLALPTHELINDKNEELKKRGLVNVKCITHNALAGWNDRKEVYKFQGVIIIDEITMRTQQELDEIIAKHPNSIIYLLGDIDKTGIPYQCFFGEETPKYNVVNVIEYKTDYRSTDEKTKIFKQGLREIMETIFTTYYENEYSGIEVLKSFCKFHLNSENQPKDDTLILTGSRWICDYYNSIGKKALNSHRIQGKTLTDNFYIDLTTMSLQKLYTCISRCRSIDQITLIDKTSKESDMWAQRNNFLP